MPTFYYTAKSQKGEIKSGTLEAKDKHSLAQALRREGFILTSAQSIGEEQKKKKSDLTSRLKGIIGRVTLVEKVMFARHLAVMIGAGFSLHKGLEVLAKQTKNSNFKRIINDITNRIKKGETLAGSLAKYPKVFNNFFVSMVKVGEKGGNLEEVLKILADYLKKEHEFRAKVRGAMVYPAVIVIAMIGIGILMMVVVMPKLTAMFEELKVELPFATRVIIAISNFLVNYFVIGILILLAFIVIVFRFLQTKKGRQFLSWFFLKTPPFNKITRKMNCAKFARGFSSLMKSGVPVVESLNITAQTVGNFYYSKSLAEAATEVKKGKKIQESIEKNKEIYPVLVSQMIGVGEETGQLSEITERLAGFYEEEVKNITDNLASVIEPVLMIIIGVIVGFFAVSMIQPMYSMMQGL
jgi:type IV pilus assembly protein PilC